MALACLASCPEVDEDAVMELSGIKPSAIPRGCRQPEYKKKII